MTAFERQDAAALLACSPHCQTSDPHGPHWCPESVLSDGTTVEDFCVGAGEPRG